ncbi:hypothetical protein B6U84_01030 [Candidatus Bathyarchaeota archaeon ex4484_40]|nr:MAG: hypothetical protein B6U84_01030 [Candidatus Bathyarchaeota archaeon ex4484_40]
MVGIRKSGEFVTPGEKLGVIEEFIPDFGTYVNEGSVRSKVVGSLLLDLTNRKVSVYPLTRRPSIPRVGSLVIGTVVGVQDSYHLSTKGLNLGVIYAFCSRCGGYLTLARQRRLRCSSCGHIERRKIASDYGKFIL